MSETDAPDRSAEELAEVLRNRRREALDAGMSIVEAKVFAESDIDVGLLRHLTGRAAYGKRELHCPPDLLAKILL